MVLLDSNTALMLLARLHAHKNAGYGDAWRKRGEVLSIFANLARKYDRLVQFLDQGVRSRDERILDTAGDLCVYAGKYLTWLAENAPAAFDATSSVSAEDCADQGGTEALEAVLKALEPQIGEVSQCWASVRASFVPLETALIAQSEGKGVLGWEKKVVLTWELAASSAGLLIALSAENEDEVEAWRAEIEAMS